MLMQLLKSLLARRRRHAVPQEKTTAPPAPAPAPDGEVSQLDLLSRLASLASGQDVRITGKQAPGGSGTRAAQTEVPIAQIIARAAALRSTRLEPAIEARVLAFERAFKRVALQDAGVDVFVYHADMPAKTNIDYVDATFVPEDFDYFDILRRFIERIRTHCAGATITLVTASGARYRALAAADVAVVELDLDTTCPMYERATALLAYARSRAFARNTVCLDADALVNRRLDDVFSLGFDVGITFREGPRLMPANEGVLFLCARRPDAVRRFLECRLATYTAVAADPFITGYYGDVKRWRGGQLSLNALVHDLRPYSPYWPAEAAGARLRFLPCDTFNFSGGEGEAASSVEQLDERFVVHYKGSRKYAFVFAARAERSSGAAG